MVIGGPIVTVISGSLVAARILNFFITFIIIIIADLTGDTIYYSIGRWGGLKFIKKYGHYFWIDDKRVESLKNHFKKYGFKTLLFGKISQAIGAVILVAAGAAEMPYSKFFLYNLIATIPKSLIFLLIGYYFLQVYLKFHSYSSYIVIIYILLIILIILIYKYIFKKSKLK
jgi:membrane protein DedA with SNARE-associated domain